MPPNLTDPPVIILLSVLVTTIGVIFKLLIESNRKIVEQYEIRIRELQERLTLEEEENKQWQASSRTLLKTQEELLPSLKAMLMRRGR